MRTDLSIRHNIKLTGLDADGKKIYEHEGHNIWLDNGRTWISLAMAYDFLGYVPADPPSPIGGDAEPNPAGPPVGTYTRVVNAPVGGPGIPTTAGVKMPWLPFYMGVGIGGNQQTGPVPTTGVFPGGVNGVGDDYPGTNAYSDADPTVPGLERPVRIRTGVGWARWLQPFASVAWGTSSPYMYVKFTCSFAAATDINPASLVLPGPVPGLVYATVPLSEIALFRWDPAANGAQPPPNPAPVGTPYVPPGYVTGAALAYETFPTFPKTVLNSLIAEWTLLFA